jgi:hypothetical protein
MSRLIITPQALLNSVGYAELASLDVFPGDTISAAARMSCTDYGTSDPASIAGFLVFANADGDIVAEFLLGVAAALDGSVRVKRNGITVPAGATGMRFEFAPVSGHVETITASNLQVNFRPEASEFTIPSMQGPQGVRGERGERGEGDRLLWVFRANVTAPPTPSTDVYPPVGWSTSIPATVADQLVWASTRWQREDGTFDPDEPWSTPGNIRGPEGPMGPVGFGIDILDVLTDPSELPLFADLGDAYLIGVDLYVWDGTDWVVIGNALGPPGPPGPAGITWRGDWNVLTAYAAQDGVHHDGKAWIANASSTGVEPGELAAEWDLLADKGGDGAAGPAGPPGPPADLSGGRTTRGAAWVNSAGGAIQLPINDVSVFVPADTAIMRIIIAGEGGPGSAEIDIRKTTSVAFPTEPADSIVTGPLPAIVAGVAVEITDLTGINTFIEAGRWLTFHLSSVSGFTTLYFTLELAAITDGGSTSHGTLANLSSDDHPQYYNQARGDARYALVGHGHAGVYAVVGHTHDAEAIVSGTLPVGRGGTGLSSVASLRYLRGTGDGALEARTAAQVRADIAAAPAGVFIPPARVGFGLAAHVLNDLAANHMVVAGFVGAKAYTIPTNASVAHPVGTMIHVQNPVSGAISLTPAVGVTLQWMDGSAGVMPTGTRLLAQAGVCTLEKADINTWRVYGVGVS